MSKYANIIKAISSSLSSYYPTFRRVSVYAFAVLLLEGLSQTALPEACKALTCFLLFQCVRRQVSEVQCGVLPR
jgi:hypothetical protein